MSKLFIYYSLSGNGDVVSDYLRKNGYDIIKIETAKPFPKSMALRIISGGFKATIKYKEKILDFDKNIDKYDEIIIGTPIWNSRISSPINTVLKLLDLTNKKVTFILYSGSGKAKHAAKRINIEYPNAHIVLLQEPKSNDEELKKISV